MRPLRLGDWKNFHGYSVKLIIGNKIEMRELFPGLYQITEVESVYIIKLLQIRGAVTNRIFCANHTIVGSARYRKYFHTDLLPGKDVAENLIIEHSHKDQEFIGFQRLLDRQNFRE